MNYKLNRVALLLVVAVSTAFAVTSDRFELSWSTVEQLKEEDRPAAVLQAADSLLQIARSHHSEGDRVVGLMYRIDARLALDQAHTNTLLVEAEQLCDQLTDPGLRAILHLQLAEAYSEVLTFRHHRLSSTPCVAADPIGQIDEWSRVDYQKRILHHIDTGLTPADTLFDLRADEFGPLITTGNRFRAERPSLFDLLAAQTLEIYGDDRWTVRDEGAQTPMSFDIPERKRALYDRLIGHYRTRLPQAAFSYRLEQLLDGNELSKLDSLISDYIDHPFVTDAIAAKIQWKMTVDRSVSTERSLLALCNETIERFGDYSRIGLITNLRNQLMQIELNIETDQVTHPSNPVRMVVGSKNCTEYDLTVYRLDDNRLTGLYYRNDDPLLSSARTETVYQSHHTVPPAQRDTLTRCTLEGPRLQPGLYQMEVVTSRPTNVTTRQTFVVSRFAAASRSFETTGPEFTVFDRKSGKPQPHVPVCLYRSRGENLELVKTLTTDSRGVALLTDSLTYTHYTMKQGDDRAFPLSRHYPSYSPRETEPREFQHGTLFTDRATVRPGQTVGFKGIIWQQRRLNTTPLAGEKVTVLLRDANRKEAATMECIANEFGSFAGEFSIPLDRLKGSWSIELPFGSVARFDVIDYKRPSFEVTILPCDSIARFGQPYTFRGKATAYTGVPQEGAQVTYNITRRENRFWRMPLYTAPVVVAHGTVTTDKEGMFDVSFTPDQTGQPTFMPFTFELKADVTNRAGETQTSARSLAVGTQPFVILSDLSQEVNREKATPVVLSVVNLNGRKVSMPLRVELWSVQDATTIEQAVGYQADRAPETACVFRQTVESNTPIETFRWSDWAPGRYRMKVKGDTTDLWVHDFVLFSPSARKLAVTTPDFFRVVNHTFSPNQPAEVCLGSSAREVWVIEEIFADGKRLSRQMIRLDREQKLLSYPYRNEYGKEITLSFFFVKEGKFYHHTAVLQKEEPSPLLSLQWETFRDRLRPGERERWTLRLNDLSGQPVQGEVMATMFDASLESLNPLQWRFDPSTRWSVSIPPLNPSVGYYKTENWEQSPLSFVEVDAKEYDRLRLLGFDRLGMEERSMLFSRSSTRAFAAGTPKASGMDMLDLAENKALRDLDDNTYGLDERVLNINPVQPRTRLIETAFFFPQLQTDREGRVSMQFTLPETLTRWKLMLLGTDRNLRYVRFDTTVTAVKEVMVTPHLPRFVTQGDSILLTATVTNHSSIAEEIRCQWDIVAERSANRSASTLGSTENVEVKAGQSVVIRYGLKVPSDGSSLQIAVTASTPRHSDGEQHKVPVLSNRMVVTETTPFTILRPGVTTLSARPSKAGNGTLLHASVELMPSPWVAVVAALPSLTGQTTNDVLSILQALYAQALTDRIVREHPSVGTLIEQLPRKESASDLLTVATPWLNQANQMRQQRERLQQLLRTDLRAQQLETLQTRLTSRATTGGGWSWVEGMPASVFITLRVVNGLSRLNDLEALQQTAQTKTAVMQALNFLDRSLLKKESSLNSTTIEYLAVRSAYRDIPIGGDMPEEHHRLVNEARTGWKKRSFLEKGQIAIALYNYGDVTAARDVAASLRDYSSASEATGMFWANNLTRATAPQQAIAIHTLLTEALARVDFRPHENEALKRWLLRQKQTQHWSSPTATADAAYTLLMHTDRERMENPAARVEYNGRLLLPAEGKPGVERLFEQTQAELSVEEIQRGVGPLRIETSGKEPLFGSLYHTYEQELAKVSGKVGVMTLQKKVHLPSGKPKPGDRLTVSLTLTTDRDLDYVRISDRRSANTEPVEQRSGMQYNGGVPYYREITDAGINLYVEHLPRGVHRFEYVVFVSMDGACQPGIATAESLYAPQFSCTELRD